MGMVILDGVDNWPRTPDMYTEWNGFEPPTVAKVDLTDHGELKT